jgi:hypothetical protein
MDLTVDTTKPVAVEVGATGVRQLAQEIRTVLATRKGSVPLDRDFGVSWELIDRPLPAAKQLIIAEVARQLEKYVPRIRFKSIAFPEPTATETADGVLRCVVTVSVREEYENEFRQS